MNNNYILASFYVILCSLSCIASDTLSKIVSLDTNLLMLIRFFVSSIILTYCHYYVFQYEYWEEEYNKKNPTINSLITISNFIGSLLNFKIFNILSNIKKIYDLNISKADSNEMNENDKNEITQTILNFIKNPIFKIWTIFAFYITYIQVTQLSKKFFLTSNYSNIITILSVLLSIIIASKTEITIIKSFIKPFRIKKETLLIFIFLIFLTKDINKININIGIFLIVYIAFFYIFFRYCVKIKRNIITYKNVIRGLLFGIGMMLFTNGLKKLPLALVILLNFCTPIITTILSAIILKEELKHRLLVCIANTIGILISVYPKISTININAILSVIGASTCFAIIDVFNKNNIKEEIIKATIKEKIEKQINQVVEEKAVKNIINICAEINESEIKKRKTIIEEIYANFKSSEQESKKTEKIIDILLGSSLIASVFFLILVIFDKKDVIFVSFFDVFNQKNGFFISFFDVFYAILISFLAILIPFFMLKASQKADLASLQSLKYIEFPLSIFVGYFLFSENLNLSFFIGFFIIIITTIYGYCREIQKSI